MSASAISWSPTPANVVVSVLQHAVHGGNRRATGRSRLSAATGAAIGARCAQAAALLPSARSRWPLTVRTGPNGKLERGAAAGTSEPVASATHVYYHTRGWKPA